MASIAPASSDHVDARDNDLREFLIVVRRALLLVIDFIERRYDLKKR